MEPVAAAPIAYVPNEAIDLMQAISENSIMILTATAVMIVAYATWGVLGALTTATSLFLFYTFFGPVVRVLNYFDLGRVLLAVAAFVLPYLGGIASILGSAYLGVCLLSYEWNIATIRFVLENQVESLTERNQTLDREVRALEVLVQQLEHIYQLGQERNGALAEMRIDIAHDQQQLQDEGEEIMRKFSEIRAVLSSVARVAQDPANRELLQERQELQREIGKLNELIAELKQRKIQDELRATQMQATQALLDAKIEASRRVLDEIEEKIQSIQG